MLVEPSAPAVFLTNLLTSQQPGSQLGLALTAADQCHCAHLCALLHADSSLWRAGHPADPAERILEVAAAHIRAAPSDARPRHARCVVRAQRSALAGVLRVQEGRVCGASYFGLQSQENSVKQMTVSAEPLLMSELLLGGEFEQGLHDVLSPLIQALDVRSLVCVVRLKDLESNSHSRWSTEGHLCQSLQNRNNGIRGQPHRD